MHDFKLENVGIKLENAYKDPGILQLCSIKHISLPPALNFLAFISYLMFRNPFTLESLTKTFRSQ